MNKKQNKQAAKRAGHPFMPSDGEMLEVLDDKGLPFMLMPRASVMQQQLRHRVVLVVVRSRERSIYIHKRSAKKKRYANLWSVSASGFIKAGEAAEDAALRELQEELGISGVPLFLASELPASPSTDWGHIYLFVSQPAQVIVNPSPDEIEEGMFVDEDELEGMLRDMPELIGPSLHWAATVCDLFDS